MLRWRSLLARMAARFNGPLGPAAGFSPAVLWCHGAGLQVSGCAARRASQARSAGTSSATS